jgi:hypothetical protein
MKKLTVAAALLPFTVFVLPVQAEDYEQITLHNITPFQVTMNVDGHYGCTANSNVDCTSAHEKVSAHNITAVYQGQTVAQKSIGPMRSYTFVVCYGDYARLHGGACPGTN